MKQHMGRVGLLIVSVILIGFLIGREYQKGEISNDRNLYVRFGDEIIQTWEKDGIWYLFLPSGASLEKLELASYSPEFYIQNQNDPVKRGEALRELTTDQEIACRFADSKEAFTLYVMQSANISSLFITTTSGGLAELKEDKEYRVSGTIHAVDAEGIWEKKLAVKSLGGRGNTSFAGYEKKPFSFTLGEAASIQGLPFGENYALISNASDPSLIRNDLVRRMEEALELPYSHAGRFVDLYVNGQYEGMYYLCDDIEIGDSRIAIPDMENVMDLIYNNRNYQSEEIYETQSLKARKLQINPEDLSGGYLMEREYEERFRQEYEDIESAFITESGEHFVVKSPQYCSVEQITYLSTYVNEAEQAILSEDGIHPQTGKHYSEYIDVDSFVKKYLAEEVSKNYDAGVSSSYFYKDCEENGGKLYAGPGWDYDMSLGNYVDWMEEFSADPTGISELAFHTYASSWYTELYHKSEFYELVKTYYRKSVEPFLQQLLDGGIGQYEEKLSQSALMNECRWQEELLQNPYYENRQQTFRELTWFLSERKMYLDEAWMQ